MIPALAAAILLTLGLTIHVALIVGERRACRFAQDTAGEDER